MLCGYQYQTYWFDTVQLLYSKYSVSSKVC